MLAATAIGSAASHGRRCANPTVESDHQQQEDRVPLPLADRDLERPKDRPGGQSNQPQRTQDFHPEGTRQHGVRRHERCHQAHPPASRAC